MDEARVDLRNESLALTLVDEVPGRTQEQLDQTLREVREVRLA
jgi:hypothetical protein